MLFPYQALDIFSPIWIPLVIDKKAQASTDNNEIPILDSLWKWNFIYKIRYREQTLLLKILQIFAQKIFLFLKCNYFYYIEESGNGHFENIVPTSLFITLNKPPPKNPQIFINRRRSIGVDTVSWKFILFVLDPTLWAVIKSNVKSDFFFAWYSRCYSILLAERERAWRVLIVCNSTITTQALI